MVNISHKKGIQLRKQDEPKLNRFLLLPARFQLLCPAFRLKHVILAPCACSRGAAAQGRAPRGGSRLGAAAEACLPSPQHPLPAADEPNSSFLALFKDASNTMERPLSFVGFCQEFLAELQNCHA